MQLFQGCLINLLNKGKCWNQFSFATIITIKIWKNITKDKFNIAIKGTFSLILE